MKQIEAIAVVKKKNPKISLLDIYSKRDAKDIFVGKEEKKIVVVIMEK